MKELMNGGTHTHQWDPSLPSVPVDGRHGSSGACAGEAECPPASEGLGSVTS